MSATTSQQPPQDPDISDIDLPLDALTLQVTPRWRKIVTIDCTAKLLEQYPMAEDAELIQQIRFAEHRPIDKVFQWTATKGHFESIQQAITDFSKRIGFLRVVISLIIAFLGGIGAWQTLQSAAEGRINVFWWLLAFLGMPLFALILWALSLLLPKSPASPLAKLLEDGMLFAHNKLRRWQRFTPIHEQVTTSAFDFFRQPGIARWYTASQLHWFWLFYILGGTLVLVMMLSFTHYIFVWQTSWLTPEIFTSIIQTLNIVPSWIGFEGPSAEQIRDSQWTGIGGSIDATAQWASLMIGCALVYGLLPRLFCWILSRFMLAYRYRKAPLNIHDPHYGKYVRLMTPEIESSVGALVITAAEDTQVILRHPLGDFRNKLHWMRFESMVGLPFSLRQVHNNSLLLMDLDDLDSHDQAAREVAKLTPDNALAACIAVNICQVPDQGFEQFLRRILQASHVRIIVLLSGIELMRARGESEDVADRIDSWRTATQRAQLHPDDCLLANGAYQSEAKIALTHYLASHSSQTTEPLHA